jgi:BirA family transcriptional regulator, biotin operon repressor / biotin---[acetyl-CoA-carboxylase] ligase
LPALNPIGQPFVELLTVESTNNYAMGLARAAMAQHGTAVFTHEQTKGKGQRGKGWVSSKGLNLALSVMVAPTLLRGLPLFSLSMAAAVAVQELVSNYINNDVTIKWPNDIYWRDRKAAGILIENIWQGGEWLFSVIGVGLNVNQTDFGELNTRAVSLKQISGTHYEPLTLAKELCTLLDNKYQLLCSNASDIEDQYNSHLYKINGQVRLRKEGRVFEAVFTGVNNNGQMVIHNGIEEVFNVGEVEWVINGA